MNTVKDLRHALSEEVKRLQPPAGLETRVLQLALRPSAAVVPAHRAGRGGAVRSWKSKSTEAPRLMALVAALLVVAIVLSLVFAARALHLISTVPADHRPVPRGLVVKNVDFPCLLPTTGLDPMTKLFVQVQLPGGVVLGKSNAASDLKLPTAFARDFAAANAAWNPTNDSYDVQAGQWVPAFPQAISPDGRSWAYATGALSGHNGTVHVVDVASGSDRQLYSGAGAATLLGFLSSGIYFVDGDPAAQAPSGYGSVWVVDPAHSDFPRKIGPYPFRDLGVPGEPALGAAGAFAVNVPLGAYADRVERMDLTTGDVTTWFTSSIGPAQMKLLGLDAQGRPIIAIGPANQGNPFRVLLLTGPNRFVEIADGSNTNFRPDSATGDSHGIWFSEPGSIWLYQAATGLRVVFAVPSSLSPTSPSPNPNKFPNGIAPSPAPPTPGEPSGYELTVIGPCT